MKPYGHKYRCTEIIGKCNIVLARPDCMYIFLAGHALQIYDPNGTHQGQHRTWHLSAVMMKPSIKSLYVAVRLLTSIAVTIAARKNLIIDTDLFSDVE